MRGYWLSLTAFTALGCSDASLKTFNAEPTATITSHADGEELLEEDSTTLRGTVSDSDHDASDLLTTWRVNGETICEDLVPEADGSTSCGTTLATGAVTVALEVSDPNNATGSDSIGFTVTPNTPPDVSLTDPFEGERYYADEAIEFKGRVTDDEDAFDVLTVSIESDIQGALELNTTLNAEGRFSDFGSLDAGTHIITVTATDLGGKTGRDQEQIEVLAGNTAPSIASVEITPDPAMSTDTLNCGYTGFSDADGDEDNSTYAWSINGEAAGTESTLPEGFGVGDTVTCTVTPNDGTVDGDPVSASIVISNTSPEMLDVIIEPGEDITTSTTLECEAVWSDADGEVLAPTFSWTRDDDTDFGTDPTLVLDPSFASPGDVFTCTATVTDGTGATATGFDSATVGNTAPNVLGVVITPDTEVTATSSLTCAATAEDADGGEPSISYAWEIDGFGVGVDSALDLSTTAAVSGETVTCTATATDSSGASDSGSDSVIIENTAPDLDSVTLSPDPVYTNDTITASVSTSDVEDDAVTATFDWFVEGVLVASGTGNTLSGVTYFDKHDEVYVVATPSDGTDDGEPLPSDMLVVSNTPPSAPNVTIQPACAEGWTEMPDGLRCARAFHTSTDWRGSQENCALHGGNLVRIDDAEDNEFVIDLYAATGDGSVWFHAGLTDEADEGSWVWVDGGDSDYRNWDAGQPDHAHEDCLEVVASGWGNTTCDDTSYTGHVCQVTLDDLPISPEVEVTIGPDESSVAASVPYMYGGIMTVTQDTLLSSFDVYGYSTGCSDVDYYLLSSDTLTSGTWEIEWSNEAMAWGTSPAFNNSGPIDHTLRAGKHYAFVYGGNCSGSLVFYWGSSTTIETDFGTVLGYVGQDYPGAGFSGDITVYDGGATQALRLNTSAPSGVALTCTIDDLSTDDDGDFITYEFSWDVDGEPFTDTDSYTHEGDTVPGAALGHDETWTCNVTANDGDDYGDAGSDSFYIEEVSIVVDEEEECTSLYFGGDDDLLAPASEEFVVFREGMTIESWVKWDGHAGHDWYPIATLGWGGDGSAARYFLAISGAEGSACSGISDPGYLHFEVQTRPSLGACISSASQLTAGTWHHVAAVFDAGQARIYIDGYLEASGSAPDDLLRDVGPSDLKIGRVDAGAGSRFLGSMSSVRYSSAAQYDGDFVPDWPLETHSDTVGLWALDGDPDDSSGNGHHGTLTGGTWIEDCPVAP